MTLPSLELHPVPSQPALMRIGCYTIHNELNEVQEQEMKVLPVNAN